MFIKGFTLTEALVSLLIFSLVATALLQTQLKALNMTHSAFVFSKALIRAQSLKNIANLQPENFSSLYQNWQSINQAELPVSDSSISQNQLILSYQDPWHKHREILEIKL